MRPGRPPRGSRTLHRAHRSRDGPAPGHGPYLAGPVRRAGPCRAVRPQTVRPAAIVHRVAGHQRGREDLHPGPLPPPLAPGQARAMRVNHEYERGCALAYLAAYDVHRALIFGRCEPSTGIVPFVNLVEQVMATEPYASAGRVWIVDNGSSHRGRRPSTGLPRRFRTLSWFDVPSQVRVDVPSAQCFDLGARRAAAPPDPPAAPARVRGDAGLHHRTVSPGRRRRRGRRGPRPCAPPPSP